MKGKKATIINSLCMLILCVFCLSLSSQTYAWFTRLFYVDPGLSFDTGHVSYPSMKMYLFESLEDVEDGNTPRGWQEISLVESEDDSMKVMPGVKFEDGQYILSSFQLGSARSLLKVEDDNITYLVFEIDPSAYCKDIEKTSDDYGVKIHTLCGPYDDGNENRGQIVIEDREFQNIPEDILNGIKSDIGDGTLFDVNYATYTLVSMEDTPPLPTATGEKLTAFQNLEYSTELDDTKLYANKTFLYIKITPDLPIITSITAKLYTYMPIYVFYNLSIELDIIPNVVE